MLRFPILALISATALTALLLFMGAETPETQRTLWLAVGLCWPIILGAHFRSIRDIFGAYRYRVPSEFDEIVGRFERRWSKQEVESRLGVKFPS
jgi:hypothetical protein